jgi:hypothetical protein
MSYKSLRSAVNGALMLALILGAGTLARAESDEKSDGKVVKIGRTDGDKESPDSPAPNGRTFAPERQAPKYWIGMLGGQITPDNPLRAHLDLPEGEGLIVVNVVPDSPAAKAGLKQHDILLKANDKELHEMQDLVELVLSEGPNKGQIVLDVLRHNKHETVNMVPEERPANAQMPQVDFNNGGPLGENGLGIPGELLQQFGGNMPPEFRNFGNGVIVGGGGEGQGVANVPNGVSISIQKQNGQPDRVTVKRGEETWTVVGDDPESLKQLPEDLRPSVEQMLRGNRAGTHFPMPNFERRMGGAGIGRSPIDERMNRIEKQLEALQKQLGDHGNDHESHEHAEK